MPSAPKVLAANLEKLLASGKDSALLRFGLGNAHLDAGNAATAATHLRRAVEMNPDYSAAWKLLGRALIATGDNAAAIEVYQRGIVIAEKMGDKQAMKEMQVFLKRADRDNVA